MGHFITPRQKRDPTWCVPQTFPPRPINGILVGDRSVDRIHHAFWAYMDESHHKYETGNRFKNAIFNYYRFVDTQIGELLEFADSQTTSGGMEGTMLEFL